MSRSILITGGAGFIGSHLADELLATALRFFNAYGTRQALSNPCTGALARGLTI